MAYQYFYQNQPNNYTTGSGVAKMQLTCQRNENICVSQGTVSRFGASSERSSEISELNLLLCLFDWPPRQPSFPLLTTLQLHQTDVLRGGGGKHNWSVKLSGQHGIYAQQAVDNRAAVVFLIVSQCLTDSRSAGGVLPFS